MGELSIEVEGARITVRMSGAGVAVTYRPDADGLQLIVTDKPYVSSVAVLLFQARAFQAAHDKARELGWIV